MPRISTRLVHPLLAHAQACDLDTSVLLASTGLSLKQLQTHDGTVEWPAFVALLRRFSWMETDEASVQEAFSRTIPPGRGWRFLKDRLATAHDVAQYLNALFSGPDSPALELDVTYLSWDRLLIQIKLADGCESDPQLSDLLESLVGATPRCTGLALLRLDAMTAARNWTFSIQVRPGSFARWGRSIRQTLEITFSNRRWHDRQKREQAELQDSVGSMLQAHSRTRTLNLVGLDLAECTRLPELVDTLARSLSAHLHTTGLALELPPDAGSEPNALLFSRGHPSAHHQSVVLENSSGRVGRLQVWLETESLHKDLVQELAPWIAITIQLVRTLDTVQHQSDQIADDFEKSRQALQKRQALEMQILRAQKMESLGLMAKGLAHDFNNLLFGILSSTQSAIDGLPAQSDARPSLDRVIQTVQQAKNLTDQMLTYSGFGISQVEPHDLNEVMAGMNDLLLASLPKKVQLRLELAESLPITDIDSDKIRQLILRLVQNGGQAMGAQRGELVLRTRQVDPAQVLRESEVFTNRLPEGPALLLEVSDTGRPIDKRHRHRIFDPFYEVQAAEQGLGLASVLGIVRSHRGALAMKTHPGSGNTIQILLPFSVQFVNRVPGSVMQPWQGEGTILVVDDEGFVRESIREVLELMGFVTWVAVDGDQALSSFESSKHRLIAMILDWNMPGLDGIEVYTRIRNIEPEFPVILTSANRPDRQVLDMKGDRHLTFLQKPYTMDVLRAVLQHSLAREKSA